MRKMLIFSGTRFFGKKLVEHLIGDQVDRTDYRTLSNVLGSSTYDVVYERFPIVLGHDDYTRRLHFHVEHLQQGLPLGVPNLDARLSFINSDEAAGLRSKG